MFAKKQFSSRDCNNVQLHKTENSLYQQDSYRYANVMIIIIFCEFT